MIKAILLGILKVVGGFVFVIILLIGFLLYRGTASPGYKVGWFGVHYYYKTSHEQIIYKKRRLKKAHTGSFEKIGAGYGKDKNQVYYMGKILEDADPASFSADKLFGVARLSKDKQNIYFKENLVSRDAPHFESIEQGYFKDRNFVYLQTKPLKRKYMGETHFVKIEGANPKTFESQPEMRFLGKDDQFVYYNGMRVKNARSGKLQKMEGFWTDGQSVFFQEFILENAELSSFQVLEYPYSRDRERVFYEGRQLEGANPNTFQLTPAISKDYSKDGDQLFYKDNVISNADAATFERVRKGYSFWKDKNQVYYKGQVLPDANPETFQLVNRSHGKPSWHFSKDDESVYYKTKKLEGVNPATFKAEGKNRFGYDNWSDGTIRFNRDGERIE